MEKILDIRKNELVRFEAVDAFFLMNTKLAEVPESSSVWGLQFHNLYLFVYYMALLSFITV